MGGVKHIARGGTSKLNPIIPSEEEVLSWFTMYRNWGKWGDDNFLGTLNYITPEKRQRAAASLSEGLTVSCARPVEFSPSMDVPVLFARRFMERSGDSATSTGAGDSLLVSTHGGAGCSMAPRVRW
jgi:hypothetical protein